MCTRLDDPTQHDDCVVCGGPANDHGLLNGYPDKHAFEHVATTQMRLYDLTYVISSAPFRVRRARVWADNPDEARHKAALLDPEFVATTHTPRIVR